MEIKKIPDRDVLQAVYDQGEISRENLLAQREQVAEAIAGYGIRKVLVDATALGAFPSSPVTLEHNVSISSDPRFYGVMFAVVCNELGERERFVETTGLNRAVTIRCFTSRREALEWLE